MVKKKWDDERMEESHQEQKEMRFKAKRDVAKAKQEVCDELYERLDGRKEKGICTV